MSYVLEVRDNRSSGSARAWTSATLPSGVSAVQLSPGNILTVPVGPSTSWTTDSGDATKIVSLTLPQNGGLLTGGSGFSPIQVSGSGHKLNNDITVSVKLFNNLPPGTSLTAVASA